MPTHRFFRVLLLAVGIFLLSSSGLARPAAKQADDGVKTLLPVVLKKFVFGNGTVTGIVINASLHTPEAGAQVCWGTACDLTNGRGEYVLENVASGYQILTASEDGFVTVDQKTNVIGNIENHQDIAIVPDVYSSGLQYRILITWDPTLCWPDPNGSTCWPNDLDAHMWLEPGPLNYHIGYYWHYNPTTDLEEYWLDKGDCRGLFPNACLESDATNGYGPETLAIKSFERDKLYYVGVFNYNQGQPGVPPISQTDAQVRLYDLTGLVATYQVPTNMGDLNFWYIFMLDSTVNPPIITEKNCIINYSNDPPQCP